jgi:hypothetical protein
MSENFDHPGKRETPRYGSPRSRGRQMRVGGRPKITRQMQSDRSHPTSTLSAAITLSAASVTVFSKDGACTVKVSAKKRASAT